MQLQPRNSAQFQGKKDYLRMDVPAGGQSERGAQLHVLTHLPIPKVIFTSSTRCIMYDRVNQPETKRRGSNLVRTACPIYGPAPLLSSTLIQSFLSINCHLCTFSLFGSNRLHRLPSQTLLRAKKTRC